MSILDNADDKTRKGYPVLTGVLDYFPDALLAVAEVSRLGNDQHNPGQPLHWAKEKSTDHGNTAVRHIMQRGTRDSDGGRHTAKAAWRILAMLQTEIETEQRLAKENWGVESALVEQGATPFSKMDVLKLPWYPRLCKPGGMIPCVDPRKGPENRRLRHDRIARIRRAGKGTRGDVACNGRRKGDF